MSFFLMKTVFFGNTSKKLENGLREEEYKSYEKKIEKKY